MRDRQASLSEIALAVTEQVSPIDKDPGLPYVGLEHIAAGRPVIIGTAPSAESRSTNFRFEKGDVLFGKLRPYLRKSVQAPFDGYCSTDILVLRASEGFDDGYVSRLFQSEDVFAAAVRTSIGTRMPRTSWRLMRQSAVYAPPLPEQRRIARVLDTVDAAIRQTEAVIAKLKQVKAGLLHDLLTRGLDENGELRDPVRHPEQFKDSPLGRLPKEWEVVPLGHVAALQGGYAFRSSNFVDNGVPVVRMSDLDEGRLNLDGCARIPDRLLRGLDRFKLRPGDLLVGMSGSLSNYAVVSRESEPLYLNQRVGRFVLTNDASFEYGLLELIILSHDYTRQLEAMAAGAAQKNVSGSQIESVWIRLPDYSEQKRIFEAWRRLEDRIQSETNSCQKLLLTKQGLMQDLLTGRVRVPEGAVEGVTA